MVGLHLPTLLNDTSVLNSTLDFSSDGNDDGDFSSTRVFHDAPFDKWVKQGKPTGYPFSLWSTYWNGFIQKTIIKKKNQ